MTTYAIEGITSIHSARKGEELRVYFVKLTLNDAGVVVGKKREHWVVPDDEREVLYDLLLDRLGHEINS